MKYLKLSFPTPEKNLAFDEGLLDRCEKGQEDETLRFWEPSSYFVVLGYAKKADEEIHLENCHHAAIPILRRISGGGTVLLGPGCLNYSLVLRIQENQLRNVTATNHWVMEKLRDALSPLVQTEIIIEGDTDLTLKNQKFSGNAQRRKRHFLLFHGTFLLEMDLPLISRYLLHPKKQPLYRKQRSHEEFLTNLAIPATDVKESIRKIFQANV